MIYQKKIGDRKYKNATEPPVISGKREPMEIWSVQREVMQCQCCCTVRCSDDFPEIPKYEFCNQDLKGRARAPICTNCVCKIVDKLTEEYQDKYFALYRVCGQLNIHYNDQLAHRVCEEERRYEDGTNVSPLIPWVQLYLRAVTDDRWEFEKGFWQSNDIDFDQITESQKTSQTKDFLTEQGKRDRNDIIEKFHYDPFEDEPQCDRNRLYSDLLTLSDDAMETDLVRQRAAIEIVKSFYRIDLIGKTIQELQSNATSMVNNSKVLKELAEQKKKEIDTVTSFSRDHGFAERYQTAKSKGVGTLSSIVRDGFDNHFDRLAVNRFDIETSNAMQQVADISARSMLNQVQLGDEDLRNMVEDQALEIRNLSGRVRELQEANRMLREKQVKEELLAEYEEELVQKGITDPEVIQTALDKAAQKTFFPKDGEPI